MTADEARSSAGRDFRELLTQMLMIDHVRGGLVVATDGLVIKEDLPPEVQVESLAALAATLGRELELGGQRLKRGRFVSAVFETDNGTLFVGGTPIGFIILLGDPEIAPEPIRQALRRAMETLWRAWGPRTIEAKA